MRRGFWICGLLVVHLALGRGWAQAPAPAVSIYNSYSRALEARLTAQHQTQDGFLAGEAGDPVGLALMRRGQVLVEQITPPSGAEIPGALLHHWRGSAFAPGAKAEDLELLLRNFSGYPRYFAPQVMAARTIAADGDGVEAWMRVQQRHGITVVLDSTYDVCFGRLDPAHRWSVSRSTRIAEVADSGTHRERELDPRDEHGFLWRMNTWWSWEERDGGLYLQVESVSLTRGIPVGLGWAVRPFVESIPRQSLEFTLHAAVQALRSAAPNEQAMGRIR